ncbi:stalk domain-containing protein [Paenibacillus hamazuiensis]|uniref:stalk domain-containing protein n=1 Tax=Paenibacillus hamazuiensis TaxID=2936508 RepID=UPI00200F722D|nr:stalk domain-containing protein [Paenibacillus hamazuiensis]
MALQKRIWMKVIPAVVAGLVIIQTPGLSLYAVPAAYAADAPTVTQVSEDILTSGAVLKKYVWKTVRNKKEVQVNGNVIEVDLTNPNVKLDVMTGTNNQFTKKQTVNAMAKETKAVAGINGDFYNTQAEGVPDGPEIAGGQLMATPPNLPGQYSFAIDKNNTPIVDMFIFQGQVTAKDGTTFPLGGINKTYYWPDDSGNDTHVDGLFMYTDAWGQIDRSNNGTSVPTEVLVQKGIITKIAPDSVIQMIAPKDGYILRAAGKAAEFVKAHLKEGEPLKADYAVLPKDSYKNYDVKNFKMMIGGHTILVHEGQPSAFTIDIKEIGGYSYRSRTAIGYSQDQKKAYLITVDNAGESKGMTMPELQQFMIQVGVWKGMTLDGGGSTQMVARPFGEFETKLVNKTETGIERKVVNGVGVYSTAPQGEVKGITIQGPNLLFINEQAPYSFKAYDEYYNPVVTDKVTAQWSAPADLGTFKDNVFSPTKAGITKITVASGKGTNSMDVEVVGRDQLSGMKINANDLVLTEGESYKLPVIATSKSGKTREIPPELVQWEVLGIQGSVDKGVLTVKSLAGSSTAQLIARYDGYSTMLTVPIGVDKVWYDLDNKAVMTMSRTSMEEIQASVNIVPTPWGNKVLQLDYDLGRGKNTRAAYASFDTGIQIEDQPQFMKLKVNGDESLNWLRAEVLDGSGALQYIDIAKNINWKGWKLLTVDFSDYNLKYPITLKSIYVVSVEEGQDERQPKGSIQLDDITFTYKGKLSGVSNNSVKLTVNKTAVSVNWKNMTLEQAPVIIKDNTMIPIRFVTDALGGTVRWDDKERKVTIIRGDKMIDLWIDNPDLLINGERVTAEVAPRIMNNLTMVPLRILSEKLGWKVTWDAKTQQITLE